MLRARLIPKYRQPPGTGRSQR